MTTTDGTTPPTAASSDVDENTAHKYWGENLRLMVILLAVWALVSYGFGIILREPLDSISLGGAPLGFWFAQQGSIYVFVALIFVYCFQMNKIEKKYGVSDEGETSAPPQH